MNIKLWVDWRKWCIGVAWGKHWSGSGPCEKCWQFLRLDLLPIKIGLQLWQVR